MKQKCMWCIKVGQLFTPTIEVLHQHAPQIKPQIPLREDWTKQQLSLSLSLSISPSLSPSTLSLSLNFSLFLFSPSLTHTLYLSYCFPHPLLFFPLFPLPPFFTLILHFLAFTFVPNHLRAGRRERLRECERKNLDSTSSYFGCWKQALSNRFLCVISKVKKWFIITII